MTDKFGGLPIPAPVVAEPDIFPPGDSVGDPLIGYVADFLRAVITFYVGDAWNSVQPGKSIIRTVLTNDPDDVFIESHLPALYVFRPKRATREAVETSIDIADDYHVETSRLVAQWIMDPMPLVQRGLRNQIVNAVRKVVDKAVHIGRDVAWQVPGDLDPKAATQGSSLANYSGLMALLLNHAAPGEYIVKMTAPAPQRSYDDLTLSFYLEELLVFDLNLQGSPDVELEAKYISPDQGTGLGPFDLGDTIYE